MRFSAAETPAGPIFCVQREGEPEAYPLGHFFAASMVRESPRALDRPALRQLTAEERERCARRVEFYLHLNIGLADLFASDWCAAMSIDSDRAYSAGRTQLEWVGVALEGAW